MDEYKQYYYSARPSAQGKAFGRSVRCDIVPPLHVQLGFRVCFSVFMCFDISDATLLVTVSLCVRWI